VIQKVAQKKQDAKAEF